MAINNCGSCKRATVDCPHPPETFRNNSIDVSGNEQIHYSDLEYQGLRLTINSVPQDKVSINELINDSKKYKCYYHEDLGSYYYEFCFGGLRKCYVMSKR